MVLRVALAATAAPALAGMLLVAGYAIAEFGGRPPGSFGVARNISEAAGLGSGAEVLRLLRAGAAPTQSLPIRPEIISSSVQEATALEAAVWGRRVELVKMLDELGVFPDEERARIACLAKDLDAEDIAAYLDAGTSCVPGVTLRDVLRRTAGATSRP